MNGIERKNLAQERLNRQLAWTRDPAQAAAIIQTHPSMRLHIDQDGYAPRPDPTDLIHAWKEQPWQDRDITVTCAARHAGGDDTPITPETRDMETRNRYDLKRLIHEHDYAAGLIAGPHLLAMLAKTHDQATVEKIKRSPSFEWLRGTWSRAWTADPKRALAIISRPPDARRHTTGIDRTRSLACQAARTLLAGRTPNSQAGTRITITLDAEADTIGMLTGMLDDTGIGHTASPTPDGRTGISVETRDTPALKAMLDTWMQCRDDISPDRIDGWATLRATARHETRQDPELARKARPTEPDWAATIAGRFNAGLLDKTNGSVHDDWVGGVIPPIKTSKHSQALDLVRQNERLIDHKTRTLAQEARTSGEAWVRPVLQATRQAPQTRTATPGTTHIAATPPTRAWNNTTRPRATPGKPTDKGAHHGRPSRNHPPHPRPMACHCKPDPRRLGHHQPHRRHDHSRRACRGSGTGCGGATTPPADHLGPDRRRPRAHTGGRHLDHRQPVPAHHRHRHPPAAHAPRPRHPPLSI